MTATRPEAVAGSFYDRDPVVLRRSVRALLDGARSPSAAAGEPPKAVIAPHAGHVYSGPIAATAYRAVERRRGTVTRVVLVGPAHRVPVRGLAVPSAFAFASPLGDVAVDTDAVALMLAQPGVRVDDVAHELEHSLEVHIPFVQETLGADVSIVPVVVGTATPEEVANVLDAVWGGAETLVVVSSDLSHYHDDVTAKRLDRVTADAIVARRYEDLDSDAACGAAPIRGLLRVARERSLEVRELDVRTSADTAGPPDRVVGYGAFAVG